MKERPLSASSIKAFLQCTLQYYYRYEGKKPRPGSGTAAAFGTALHIALEELYKLVRDSGKPPTKKDYDDIINVFISAAIKEGVEGQNLYDEGISILTSRLDNINPNDKILGLEVDFNLKTPAGTPFAGYIDKLIELDDETIAVVDYKSSYISLTQEEADEDIQLSMYDLAVSTMYPQHRTIICALDYLRNGEVITHRTPEQRANFVKFLDNIYQVIINTKKWKAAESFCVKHGLEFKIITEKMGGFK